MAAWKLAPALAAGNTCVLKPAETTPLSALLLAEVCQQAELPPGVVNVLTGAGETGAAVVAHPGVDKVAFTGSTEVGIAIAAGDRRDRQEADAGARRQGRERGVRRRAGRPGDRGHRQRHLLQPGPRLLRRLAAARAGIGGRPRGRATRATRLATLRLGDPLDKNTDIGAINSRAQLDRITELSAAGEAEGAHRWSPPCELPEKGYWFAPTVFTGVSQSHRIAREEIFGPVLSVLTFRTPEEAVDEGEQHPVRPLRGRLDREGQPDLVDGAADARGRCVGQHVQQVRPREPVRRVTGSPGSGGRAAGTGWRRISMSEIPKPATRAARG